MMLESVFGTWLLGLHGGETTVSPHKRCKIKFTKSEYWVNISTRGLVIFGKNAGAAVLPSLACKSTACWPQDIWAGAAFHGAGTLISWECPTKTTPSGNEGLWLWKRIINTMIKSITMYMILYRWPAGLPYNESFNFYDRQNEVQPFSKQGQIMIVQGTEVCCQETNREIVRRSFRNLESLIHM